MADVFKNPMRLGICALLVALFMGAACAYAQEVGQAELNLLVRILTGNLGYGLGLAVTALGIFTIARGNLFWGLSLILLAALVTVLPAVYSGIRDVTCPVAESLGGSCGDAG